MRSGHSKFFFSIFSSDSHLGAILVQDHERNICCKIILRSFHRFERRYCPKSFFSIFFLAAIFTERNNQSN